MSFGRSTKDSDAESTSSFMKSSSSSSSHTGDFLGQGSRVVGKLSFTGQVELDGYVEGELNSQDKLTIGEAAIINARVSGTEIFVRGTVNGDIVASKRLVLQKPAKVVGNISSTNLSIEEGVVFEGQCSMNSGSAGQTTKNAGVRPLPTDKLSATT